ncbi:Serine/threonine-protein kinase SIK1 [Geodia barretti]|nr:Serine/threonine-protein kinase SIK1 [Geodia barretti]
MLQLEPAKRIPLNKVLEHRWMQGMELDLQPTSKMRVFGSNEHIFWNSHVLAAIQKMNYDVDRCKQAVQSRLYDDYAALYYLLLNKWEHGQLQVSTTVPPTPHHRLSHSAAVPALNVNPSDFPTGQSQDQWQHMSARQPPGSASWNEYPNDPNLVRYLKLGRRHTLGAAQNHMLIPPSDLGHLREASECSSQTSNDISINVSTAISPPHEPLSLRSALGGEQADAHSSQSGSSPLSRATLMQPQVRARMGRRASDGGPYAAVFRLYLEKRMPQLAQINSRGSLCESATHSSTSSVKQLLQEKKSQETQVGKQSTQSKEWLQYKDQILHHKQLSSTSCNPATAESLVPIQPTQNCNTPNGMEDHICRNSLRAQVQPFQTYTPQQIQEQLQHLHIQQHSEADTVQVAKLFEQSHITPATREQQSGVEIKREVLPVQDSGNSVLHHLLLRTSTPAALSNSVQTNRVDYNRSHPEHVLMSQQQQRQKSAITPLDLSAMLSNVASYTSKDLPSFPVNIQAHSPTKGIERRTPVEDYQMASIAEVTREKVVGGIPDRVVVATHPGISLQYALSNGSEQHNEKTYPCSNWTGEVFSSNDHTQILQHGDSCNPVTLPTSTSPSHSITNHILNVLNSNQLQHYQTSSGIVVEHERVKFLIVCNVPHLNTIHMQFIAGDPMQYQTLSSHLATQLQFIQ